MNYHVQADQFTAGGRARGFFVMRRSLHVTANLANRFLPWYLAKLLSTGEKPPMANVKKKCPPRFDIKMVPATAAFILIPLASAVLAVRSLPVNLLLVLLKGSLHASWSCHNCTRFTQH